MNWLAELSLVADENVHTYIIEFLRAPRKNLHPPDKPFDGCR